MGGWDGQTNPPWPGRRREEPCWVHCTSNSTGEGPGWGPATSCPHPQATPCPQAVATHHVKHGVVEAFVTSWLRGCRVLRSVPGPGDVQGEQPGEETWASPTRSPPIPVAAPAKTLHIQELDGKTWGQHFGLSLKQDVCTLSQKKAALSSRNQ